jgi:hypothetical protein
MAGTMNEPEPELLTGVPEIAAFFGWPPRRVHYLLGTGRMPCAFRIGKIWHLRPATGRAWLARMERQAGAAGGEG